MYGQSMQEDTTMTGPNNQYDSRFEVSGITSIGPENSSMSTSPRNGWRAFSILFPTTGVRPYPDLVKPNQLSDGQARNGSPHPHLGCNAGWGNIGTSPFAGGRAFLVGGE